MNSIRVTLFAYYRNLSEMCEVITADKLRKIYTQTETYPQTLLALFRKHNEDELKLVDHGRVMATYKKYELAYRRVRSLCFCNFFKITFSARCKYLYIDKLAPCTKRK